VRRAFQLPECGRTRQVEPGVELGRFRERGSGRIEAAGPAQGQSPQGSGPGATFGGCQRARWRGFAANPPLLLRRQRFIRGGDGDF